MIDPKKAGLIIRKVNFNHEEVVQGFVEQLELWWRRSLTSLTSPVLRSFFRDVLNNCDRYERKTNDPKYDKLVLLLDEDEILDEKLIVCVRDKGKTVTFQRIRRDNFKRNYKLIKRR